MKRRGPLEYILRFLAAGALVGIPVASLLDLGTEMCAVVILGVGLVGAIYGDRFLNWVADSDWWSALSEYLRRRW